METGLGWDRGMNESGGVCGQRADKKNPLIVKGKQCDSSRQSVMFSNEIQF